MLLLQEVLQGLGLPAGTRVVSLQQDLLCSTGNCREASCRPNREGPGFGEGAGTILNPGEAGSWGSLPLR